MKSIVEYINESSTPHFVDTFIKELKRVGIANPVNTYGPRDEMEIVKGVDLSWRNGKTVQHIPRTFIPSSRFDDEPAYVSILDSYLKDKKIKGFFDELTDRGLIEATRGKNAQWGTWKFAIRDDVDVNTVINALKNNDLI